ncbi:RHS domain-containing protein, partial [Desulfosarcina sp. OttesenSCG-928-G10]|nr:RHS domain-containing protein [Desulfosarcina sp. OttesenSCG-928-G10]
YWYENDARGAPHKLTSSSGRIVWQGVYDAFGN